MEKKTLSASSIKSIETCTWIYWNQYECKVPQKTNDGALRGSIVHTIFEVLLNPRHKKHFLAITTKNSVNGSGAVRRLLIKNLGKSGILNVDNFKLCNDMILVGLRTDFFGATGKLGQPEYRFELTNDDPEYKLRGYIDKLVFYEDGALKIVDYKSSKKRFEGDDLSANVQAMAYSLVGYKIFKAKTVSTDFIFLRYPKAPVQTVKFTLQQLSGFEQYMAYIYQLINPFDEVKAKGNLAANNKKNKWLCKAGAWECPYRRPFQYWAVVGKDDKVARTSLRSEDLRVEEGQRMVLKQYKGCPAFPEVSAPDEL